MRQVLLSYVAAVFRENKLHIMALFDSCVGWTHWVRRFWML